MAENGRRLVVAVRPGSSPTRSGEVLRWIRRLLPAAILFVGTAALPVEDADEVISVDVDEVESGPLSLADALVRDHRRR
jgi:hypothetical protein